MEGQRKKIHHTGRERNVLKNLKEELRVLLLPRGPLHTGLNKEGTSSSVQASQTMETLTQRKNNVDLTSYQVWEGLLERTSSKSSARGG